jgi:hypothetical protein
MISICWIWYREAISISSRNHEKANNEVGTDVFGYGTFHRVSPAATHPGSMAGHLKGCSAHDTAGNVEVCVQLSRRLVVWSEIRLAESWGLEWKA